LLKISAAPFRSIRQQQGGRIMNTINIYVNHFFALGNYQKVSAETLTSLRHHQQGQIFRLDSPPTLAATGSNPMHCLRYATGASSGLAEL